jgi:hypothetical protein
VPSQKKMHNLQKVKSEKDLNTQYSFETLYKILPLAPRVLGLLIADECQLVLSFDGLVEKLAGSKSSTLTNINLLLKTKKYFVLQL